jgi:nicotinamide mononucleotide transporter
MAELLFMEAFTAWGSPTSWLEIAAVAIALAMVGCNIREIHWGWPLAIVSSLMYFALFWRSRLYGDAGLQIFFAVVALWGWFQWLRGVRADGHRCVSHSLRRAAGLMRPLAPALPAMDSSQDLTDTDVPWGCLSTPSAWSGNSCWGASSSRTGPSGSW